MKPADGDLARALRENLHRRKGQTRARATPTGATPAGAESASPDSAKVRKEVEGACLYVRGGTALSGRVPISGAKNAALPILVASLLSDAPLVSENLPCVSDLDVLAQVLVGLGARIESVPESNVPSLNAPELRLAPRASHALAAHTPHLTTTRAEPSLVRRLRASILVLGPLLARAGQAEVVLPGGDAIGERPIDLHLFGLERLGAVFEVEGEVVRGRAPGGLRGAKVEFPSVSVGATENVLMAACLARGESELRNCAVEPEIEDLARCLVAMGACIDGIGTACLRVQGATALAGARHRVVADRIEAGTYAVAAAITRGRLELEDPPLAALAQFRHALAQTGVRLEVREADGASPSVLVVDARDAELRAVDIETAVHPGFPTDLQAQFMALAVCADGISTITETIFENRFMHVRELVRLGAEISVSGASARVSGPRDLVGAPVLATDLRASVSLVLAGLAASGETCVQRIDHLDRGYGNLEGRLAALGADIERRVPESLSAVRGAGSESASPDSPASPPSSPSSPPSVAPPLAAAVR